MCKYAKNNGIVVKTIEQREMINRIILESRNNQTPVSSGLATGKFDPRVWELDKTLES